MKRFIVKEHMPIETARKDICFNSEEPYEGLPNQVSEWAMAVALSRFPIGAIVTAEEFHRVLNRAILDQTLCSMHEKGVLDIFWDEEHEDFAFKIKDDADL